MNLIIQGLEINNSDLRTLAKLSHASGIERITGQAFRLTDAEYSDEVASHCADIELDYAFVNPQLKFSDFRLIAMDMDSTLLAIESIDEIADMHDIKPQVAAITQQTMRGEISFEESLTRRTQLLQGLHQDALQKVYDERVRLSPGAEKMLQQAQRAGIKTMVISGGFTFFTERIKTRLGLDYAAANVLQIEENRLTGKVLGKIIGREGKADVLNRVRDELGIKPEQIIAMGDGANDLDMMTAAGVSIAYHAKPIVREHATYSLNYVGLDGVVNLFG
ncbi:phosphoserine phosphatase SerB [Nitrosomonas sp. JL21]|uniref:phosphoserine phosphatase SerB n=1 Tax=Nitrosomonas sp. JL21 TaxID=153949 RepID=UPI00136CC5BE|nr:phosphoserine phosphatase SerB [Nitrosomonas sp. JL21]MBL8496444.1 phosphoserine phosphatase SerB [Nitrosomonas sp.]MXS78794.1 phosphoserine phosphatase SerB [Nitrosomonas sp. JL21]